MRRFGFIATFSLIIGGLLAGAGCRTVQSEETSSSQALPTGEAVETAMDRSGRALGRADVSSRVHRAVEASRVQAAEALQMATDRAGGWQIALPQQPSWKEILGSPPADLGSISKGSVSHGHMLRAQKFPLEGPNHSVIDRHRSRNTNWGTDELVELLLGAAADVAAEFPGSTMRVGNLGYPEGGDIYWSSSHNNGRDADLAFYARRADTGERVQTPGLVEFGPDGRARSNPNLVFDTPRNWVLIRSLLTGEAQIQWLFVSTSLKERLLTHAREIDAPDHLIRRARSVLHQPTDAPPHADHLHVRITCSLDDRLRGCIDWGPRWNWVDWYVPELKARALALGEALRRGDDPQKRTALDLLESIRSPYSAEVALRFAVDTDSDEYRQRALEVAEAVPLWSATALVRVEDLLEGSTLDPELRETAYAILRQSDDPLARNIAIGRLLDDRLPASERAMAADALRHRMEAGLVPLLLRELKRQEPSVRAELAVVVRRITGAAPTEIDWASARDAALESALAKWARWWERNRETSRTNWIRRAFERHGAKVRELTRLRSLDQLIPLLEDTPDRIAYLAHRRIREVTDRWVPLEDWGFDRLHGYWSDWWSKNRQRLLAEREVERESLN